MKVYVDELPKDCLDCPCESEYCCKLLNDDVGCCKWGEIHKNCPLQSLADYTKRVRQEVIKEIKNKIIDSTCYETEEEIKNCIYDLNASEVLEILDQTQGDKK